MKIRSFIRRRPWMHNLEWRTVLRHLRVYEALFTERNVHVTPFLLHHLDDVLTLIVLVARAERGLVGGMPEDPKAPAPPLDLAALEQIFQLRAELRNAAHGLESLIYHYSGGDNGEDNEATNAAQPCGNTEACSDTAACGGAALPTLIPDPQPDPETGIPSSITDDHHAQLLALLSPETLANNPKFKTLGRSTRRALKRLAAA